ncbi:hypothetical protein FWJ25_00625 [Marinobacter salinexigens]|uniref:Uncharacterized protein n=1 Tax=Marinobacter salinexigens TaxID=2919747 RepID=A0A5B0VM89_9GAMM|nr:hypothetical protein [Marinobacter salinexigens]KAA1175676.1 hypothetical protein FWJ25_00625 [Marinobacter salinexigens]
MCNLRLNQCLMITILLSTTFVVRAESLYLESPLSDASLDGLRGGFLLDDLEIMIGLEQAISVNGELMAINRLTIPNLNQLVSEQGIPHQFDTELRQVVDGLGAGTLVTSTLGDGRWLTVIQNNLNGITIQNARELTIELNNLGGGFGIPGVSRDPVPSYLRP